MSRVCIRMKERKCTHRTDKGTRWICILRHGLNHILKKTFRNAIIRIDSKNLLLNHQKYKCLNIKKMPQYFQSSLLSLLVHIKC